MKHNIETIRAEALKVIADLRQKKLPPPVAGQINSAIGKTCTTLRLQFDYARLNGRRPSIPFMEVPRRVALSA